MNAKGSKYHASFDAKSAGQDLKFSKHFRSLTFTTADSIKAVSHPSPSESKPSSTRDVPRYQLPRPFTSEFAGKYYNKGFVLDSWETGAKDLIKPAHEFKILRIGVKNSEDDCIKKFVHETLRFACGCLNERTNGTIHFGVADEMEEQTCGYQPREIVGCSITNKPGYNDKLTEFIDECFVGDSRSNVHNCIRPPVFIPVQAVDGEVGSDDIKWSLKSTLSQGILFVQVRFLKSVLNALTVEDRNLLLILEGAQKQRQLLHYRNWRII